jgi:AcrR family transcriptional regulator
MTHREILSAALRVFGEKGYSATRLEDVAKEAGISRGPIYRHLSSKENLHSEILKASLKRSIATLTAISFSGVSADRGKREEFTAR